MATNARTKTASAPEPSKRNEQDPAALLMAALQASAKTIDRQRRIPRKYQQEPLTQPLTDRDAAALAQLGWVGRLSSPQASRAKTHGQGQGRARHQPSHLWRPLARTSGIQPVLGWPLFGAGP